MCNIVHFATIFGITSLALLFTGTIMLGINNGTYEVRAQHARLVATAVTRHVSKGGGEYFVVDEIFAYPANATFDTTPRHNCSLSLNGNWYDHKSSAQGASLGVELGTTRYVHVARARQKDHTCISADAFTFNSLLGFAFLIAGGAGVCLVCAAYAACVAYDDHTSSTTSTTQQQRHLVVPYQPQHSVIEMAQQWRQ